MKSKTDILRIDQLPEDTQSRKVTTEIEIKSGGNKTKSKVDTRSADISILCHGDGEMKPASA